MQHKLTHSNEKEAEMREMYLSQQSRLTELIEQLNTVTKEKKQLLSDLCNEKSLRTNMEDTQAKQVVFTNTSFVFGCNFFQPNTDLLQFSITNYKESLNNSYKCIIYSLDLSLF